MESENVILTPLQVAKICHSCLPLIYRQLRNGTIPSVKLGDKYLISRTAFEKWLDGEKLKSGAL